MAYRSATHALAQGARDVLPLTTGIVPFGLITGVTAVGMGMSPSQAMGMTVLFYSGSAQLVVMQLMQSGALPVTMVVTALVINLRFLMYSASLSPQFSRLARRHRWPLAYVLSDQSFALWALKNGADGAGNFPFHYYTGTAVVMWFGWTLAVLAGVLLGTGIPESWSLGFAIPLSFLALLVPSIRSSATLGAALAGGLIAVLAAALPFNLGLLLGAVGGVTTGVLIEQLRGPSGERATQEAS
jgi:4-azaleucine resistance transporter AzlC